MKNSRLKNSLIAASIAVLAGVLVFSVNAAIGDAPGYDPPGGGVSPTFSGMLVTGTANINDISLNGSMNGGSIVTDSLISYGNVSAGGNLNVARNVRIDMDIDVLGSIDTVNDIAAGGNLEISGNVTAGGDILASGNLGISGNVTVTGDVDIDGELYAPTLVETNDLFVGGDSYFEGTLTADNIEARDIVVSSSTGSIGSYYRITGSQSPTSSYTLSCYAYDYMVGCGGYASDEYRGSLPTSETSCKSYSEVSTGRVYTRVLCFDPNGIRTGNNPL